MHPCQARSIAQTCRATTTDKTVPSRTNLLATRAEPDRDAGDALHSLTIAPVAVRGGRWWQVLHTLPLVRRRRADETPEDDCNNGARATCTTGKMSLPYTRLFAMRFWSLSCTDQNAWQRFFVVRFFLDTQQMNFFLVHLGG
jgi:hypothetical protein